MGRDVCDFKSANLTTLLEAITDRVIHHFLTSETLTAVIKGVAEVSKSMLEERQVQLARISERKRVVNTEIKNINDVLRKAGTKAKNLETLMSDLHGLETERAALEKEGDQVSEATEEALLFVTDPAGIIQTVMDYKTWLDPEDPEAVKEFFKIFIEKVEVFELEEGATDQRVDIHYDLRAFKTTAKDASAIETIHIGKKKSRGVSANNCGLDVRTGIDPVRSYVQHGSLWFPRTRGDRPVFPRRPKNHHTVPRYGIPKELFLTVPFRCPAGRQSNVRLQNP